MHFQSVSIEVTVKKVYGVRRKKTKKRSMHTDNFYEIEKLFWETNWKTEAVKTKKNRLYAIHLFSFSKKVARNVHTWGDRSLVFRSRMIFSVYGAAGSQQASVQANEWISVLSMTVSTTVKEFIVVCILFHVNWVNFELFNDDYWINFLLVLVNTAIHSSFFVLVSIFWIVLVFLNVARQCTHVHKFY